MQTHLEEWELNEMNETSSEARRLVEQSKAPNFRLPANCLKGMRLPAKICYVSKQTICLDFYGTEYVFDRRSHSDKRLTAIVSGGINSESDSVEKVLTLADVLENYSINGTLIDLSTGDIILQVTGR